MAKKWEIESETSINIKSMEGMLIEVFGCTSLEKRVITLAHGKDNERIKSDFYLDGNAMEGMLIETFGCISLDKVIHLDTTRDRKKVLLPLTDDVPAVWTKLA